MTNRIYFSFLGIYCIWAFAGVAAQENVAGTQISSSVIESSVVDVPAVTKTKKYAVLSLIGDSMDVVRYTGQTGTSLGTRAEKIALTEPVFDKAALLAIDNALRKINPETSVTLLSPSKNLYSLQKDLLSGKKFSAPSEFLEMQKSLQATHLVLVTKYKGEANLKMDRGSTGNGRLEGVGFYVDYALKIRRSDTGELGTGFLAPFAYFKVSLIDLGTSLVVSEQVVTSTTTLSSARLKDGVNPWDILTSLQKIDTLKTIIRSEISIAVPKLF